MLALINLIKYSESNLPTRFGNFRCIIYREESIEHVALVKGDISNASSVLCRVQSECITSEVFYSLRCDCKLQLDEAFSRISKENQGIILYLRQEGRGIGLGNKIKAYNLQDTGFDTVDANRLLGFPDDLRDFQIAAMILKDLSILSIRLLTNNPAKFESLARLGVNINQRLPIQVLHPSSANSYMETKKKRMGHLLDTN